MNLPQGTAAAAIRTVPHPHVHGVEEHCPLCDQPIPPEKFEEIHGRIQAKERERALEIERHLKEQLAQEKAQAEIKAKAEIEQIRKENAAALEKVKQEALAKEHAAREDARKTAEAAALAKITEMEQAKNAAQQRAKEQSEALEKSKQDAVIKEAAAREEARKTAEAAAAAKIAEAEQAKKVAEHQAKEHREALERTKQEAVAKETEAKKLAEQKAKEHQEALEKTKQEAVAKEALGREEARKAVEAAFGPKLAEADQARKSAEQQLLVVKTDQENILAQRLKEQREALEKASTEALNAEKAKVFNEKLKVEEQLQAVTRQLQQKTAEELGEGAEVDLFEALKAEFQDDKISRIDKGVAGPDIVHDVVHNGRICGCIIYDSKNRNAWRHDYVKKLRQEQLAVNADHAILSTHVFPAGKRQVHLHDGVLIANPARVVVLVELLRKQIIHNYGLRLSNEAREKKTNQLYEFVTSDQATQLLDHIEARAEDLLDLDVKEQKAHTATWKTRGQLVRAVQRSRADFVSQIDRIIGTAAEVDRE